MLFFIAGITGHVGGAAARKLLKQGHQVRSLVRDMAKAQVWVDAGVETVQGDWTDSHGLGQALAGVDGAYLMMPPTQTPSRDFREARAVVAGYVEAVRQAQPRKLVLLSSFGSDQNSGIGLITSTHLLEQGLGTSDVPVAILRPGSFLENYAGQVVGAKATGTLYSFYQPLHRKLLMTATADIGAAVADLLTTPWTGKRILEIGDEQSPADIAAAMSEALGRAVTAQAVPREHWAGALQQFGTPAEFTWAFEEMVDAVNSGHIHRNPNSTEHIAGTIGPKAFFHMLTPAG